MIDVLLGRASDRSRRSRHDELSVWGIGADLSEHEWRSVLRQLVARSIVEAVGEYGVLTPGPGAEPVLRGEAAVELAVHRSATKTRRARRQNTAQGKATTPRAAESLDQAAREIFERLRTWRTSVAREKKIAPYMVFSDATLVGIIDARPTSTADLAAVSGVGAKKLAEYGEALLAVLEDRPAVEGHCGSLP